MRCGDLITFGFSRAYEIIVPVTARRGALTNDSDIGIDKQVRNAYFVRMNYTLADLARASKAKRRSLQLWADAGIIRAYTSTERKGTGTHRLFSRDEAIIASILNLFSRRQVAIGELQRLALAIRKFLDSGKKRVALEEAIAGEQRFLVVNWIWAKDVQTPEVYLGEDLDEILGGDIGLEFTSCVLITLHYCLEGLRS